MYKKEKIDKHAVSIENSDLGITCDFNINNDNSVYIRFQRNTSFIANINFYSDTFRDILDEDGIDFESDFFRMFLEDNYNERCYDDIVSLLGKELKKYDASIEDEYVIRLFIRFDKDMYIRCDYENGNYNYIAFNICRHFFNLDDDLGTIPIKDITLECAIYDYAVNCKSNISAELIHMYGNIVPCYVEMNNVKYYVVPDIACRLCLHDNLRKLDFLNTGKLINLSDKEIKKYEGYVAKCETFGNENNVELFIKKDGTCMMMYP